MKRHHHTIPRYYLSAFRITDDAAFIWEYHRGGTPYNPGPPGKDRNPVKRTLKKASVKTDYYGPYEDDLATLEEAAKHVLETLRTTPTTTPEALLTPLEKEQLTDYLGLFMRRNTAREERLPGIWKTVQARELPRLDRAIKELMHEGRFTEALTLERKRQEFAADMPAVLRQRTTIEPFTDVRRRIIELPWTFLTRTTPTFLTSDNPVRYPEPEGLDHEAAFLTFPISTTMILFASNQVARDLFTQPPVAADCGSASVNDDQAATLNHLTITGAHHYVYSHQASAEIAFSFG